MILPIKRIGFGVVIFATSLSGFAQGGGMVLEEVIVTAQKRVESLQDVPISVSAISGEKMRSVGVTDVQGISAYVPNFSMNETGISNAITIRGISSGINQGFEQSVGMYADGIYYGRGQLARLPLFDMERIEVARGPQPILFGKNSIAGAVSMTTAKPTDEFEASISAMIEPDHGEQDFQLILSGPLSDNLSGRFGVLSREMDGYVFNTHLNRDEKQENETVVRASLSWEPSDVLGVDFKYEHAEFDTIGRNIEMVNSVALPTGGIDYISALGGAVGQYNLGVMFGLAPPPPVPYTPGDGTLNFNKSSGTDDHTNESDNFTLNIDYQFGEHTLTLVSGYVEYDFFQLCDCDFVSAPIIDGTQTVETFDQFSQEIRLTSPGGETVDYIAGLYFQDSTLTYNDVINVPPDGILRALSPAFANIDTRRAFEQDTQMLSAFAQFTWNVSDTFRLTVGGRYTTESKEATRKQVHHLGGVPLPPTDPTGMTASIAWTLNPLFGSFLIEPYNLIRQERDESKFTPLVTAQWDVNDDVMLYGTFVTGFKSGGFDVRSNGHPDPTLINAVRFIRDPATGMIIGTQDIAGVFEYKDEEATSFEFGIKASLAGGRGELNASLYNTDYEDLQTSVFDGTLGFNVGNAAKAKISGIEVDTRWLLTENFTLSASVAYLDFEFEDFRVAQCYFGQAITEPGRVTDAALGLCDATGRRKEYTPEITGTITGDYSRPFSNNMEFFLAVDLIYSDDYVWLPTLDPRGTQDSFTKINARVGIGSDDGRWQVAVIGKNLTDEDVSVFGGNATLAGPLTGGTGNAYYTFVDRPATVALQLNYNFGGY